MLPPAGALHAWERLRERSDSLDKTDIATFRMLPMVYRNLRSAGLDEAEMTLLKGVYRQFWLKTRITLRAANLVLREFRAAGVEPVALKGLGLLATAYPESALRPMHDLDFLLAPGDFVRGFERLTARGWKPLRGTPEDYLKRLRTFHALPLVGPDGVEIDLHRHMLEENCYRGADFRLLERLQTGEIDGLNVTAPSAEDQVINACVHGVRWDPVPPLRWLLDAVMVIRATGQFDWEYLEAESLQRGVGLAMAAALEFAREFEPTIPGEVPERLLAGHHSRLEQWDFRFQQGGYSAPVQVGRYATRYLRLSSGRSPWRKTREFPTYLAAMWEIEDGRSVPIEGLKRVWTAVRR